MCLSRIFSTTAEGTGKDTDSEPKLTGGDYPDKHGFLLQKQTIKTTTAAHIYVNKQTIQLTQFKLATAMQTKGWTTQSQRTRTEIMDRKLTQFDSVVPCVT